MQVWNMEMDDRVFGVLASKTSKQDEMLRDHIYRLGEFFDDMLFEPESSTREIVTCQIENQGVWENSTCPLAPELQFFSYSFFTYKVAEIETPGAFDRENQILYINPEYLDNDVVILHEMIHLHELAVNSAPMYYHDALIWVLYSNLRQKIDCIDKIINKHIYILNEQTIHSRGGLHDLLFLLKSFDLDIRKGYPFGTVFGYGMTEEFDNTYNCT